METGQSRGSILRDVTADWTKIVIHITSEVDCFFSSLKLPAVFLRQESPASPGFLVAQNIAIRSYIITQLVDPPGRVTNTTFFTNRKENLLYMPPLPSWSKANSSSFTPGCFTAKPS
jgi:hypothetical protein